MRLVLIGVIMIAISASWSANAHDLKNGQVLYTFTSNAQRVETNDFQVVLQPAGDENSPQNQITLQARNPGLVKVYEFDQPMPSEPKLTAYNEAQYCNQRVIFITLRYPIPRMADIRQHIFETHAFEAQTLAYLDTAGAPFEAIAPLEDGVDLGFEYITPQRFGVVCSNADGTFMMTFSQNGK